MKDFFEVFPGKLEKEIIIPGSKSYANRALILAALEKKPITIHNIPKSTDVLCLIDCLELIGLDIKRNGSSLTILNSFPSCEIKTSNIIELASGDGGTTNRFLMALLSLGENSYRIIPHKQFMQRPFDDLLVALKKNGAIISRDQGWINIQGPINKQKIKIDCSQTTQTASALSLVGLDLDIVNLKNSSKYYELTNYIKEKFLNNFHIPLDMSSAAPFLVFSALNGSLRIKNLCMIDILQADSCLLNLLRNSGAHWDISENGLDISSAHIFSSFEFDCSQALDLFPVLVFLASKAKGDSTFYNLENLAYKESNRLNECLILLNRFKVDYKLSKGVLTITGDFTQKPYLEFIAPKDHRIIMSAYLFMRSNSGGKIINTSAISKSLPEFFDLMN